MPIESSFCCAYCRSTRATTFNATERMLGLGGEFTYASCEECSSVQLVEGPSDMAPYYPKEYYSFLSLQTSSFFRRLVKKIRMWAFLKSGSSWLAPPFAGLWLHKLRPTFGQCIADVGCGNGQLLYELSISGFRELHGFDPYIDKTSTLRQGLTLWKQSLSQSELHFDLIFLHHSFEHMQDPDEMLRTCFEHLKPGGRLLVRCPVADASIWKDKKALWVQLDAPRHLSIPSTRGFEKAAKRAGFELEEVLFDSTAFQFWGTALYERGERLDPSRVDQYFSAQQVHLWEKEAIQRNKERRGDQACFFCVKPPQDSSKT